LTVSSLEELIVSTLSTPEGTRRLAKMLHEIANALQDSIGVCQQLRDDALSMPEHVERLEASLKRASAALGQLQPPTHDSHRGQ
jgi:hypothetical protein